MAKAESDDPSVDLLTQVNGNGKAKAKQSLLDTMSIIDGSKGSVTLSEVITIRGS